MKKNKLSGKQKFETKFNFTKRAIDYCEEDLENDVLKITNKKYPRIFGYLSNYHKAKAAMSILMDNNVDEFKRHTYLSTKLKLMGRSDHPYMFSGGYTLQLYRFFASNNQDIKNFLIKHIDVLSRKSELSKSWEDLFMSRTILLLLKGDFEEVRENCKIYEEKAKNHKSYERMLEIEYFKAFVEKDKIKMKECLEQMLEKKTAKSMIKERDLHFDFFLHGYVIMYAKIALYHGIDLEIDDEIAPKELIDITPLEEYEEYEFMKEFDLKTITIEEWQKWIDDKEKWWNNR